MPDVEKVKCLVEIFNERFSEYDLILTDEDVERGSGVIESGDDGYPLEVPYRFGVDADGDYLDYYFSYSYHQMFPDHMRIRHNRRDERLPVLEPRSGYPSDATEEEICRLEQDNYAENRRISGMLCAKGFEASQTRENVRVQVVYVSRRDENGTWITTEELTFDWQGNYDEALGAAMWIVDDALSSLHRHGMTADELFALYRVSGPDPYIRYKNPPLATLGYPYSDSFFVYQPLPFNAWGYAEVVSNHLCGTPIDVPSRSLAGWQGRYDRHDKHRMEAQLFLDRKVWLTKDFMAEETVIPAGSSGKIAEFSDERYSNEVPVMLDLEPLPLWRQIFNFFFDLPDRRTPLVWGVPYDVLEFADSDTVYAAQLDEVFAEIR
jgi:hypothetical protein